MIKKDYYPPMHTAEHLLNQTMMRLLGTGRSTTNHIEKKKSKCDYHFDRELTAEEVSRIEDQVNRMIAENLQVTEEFLDLATAGSQYNIERLPDPTTDSVRIVHIGNYDSCPCIGPHVNQTGEIGEFRIISTSFEDHILRIRFKLQNTCWSETLTNQ